MGVGEENQGRVGGSESSQEPRAVEIVSKWLDRGSDETQMLLDSFGSEEAFAKRFLGMYDQSPIVAETWSNFFTDVDAAIEELDRLFGRDSSEMYFADIDSSDDFDLDYEIESYRNMLQDAPEETIVRLYSKGTGNAKYKEISRNGAVRKLNIRERLAHKRKGSEQE